MGWIAFAAAFAVFLASHAVPARPPVRRALVARLGARGYLAAYVAVSLFALGWLIVAAGRAPVVILWFQQPWMLWVPNLAMPAACLLIAFGVVAPNPLSFGGRGAERFDPDRPGIVGLARHPLLWALALWSGAHVVPNGDLAHVLLFGLFAGFSLAGMPMLDRRLRRRFGPAEWRRLAARSSTLPLAAALSGRWRPLGRPDPLRLALAALLWLGLLAAHPAVIGVRAAPPL